MSTDGAKIKEWRDLGNDKNWPVPEAIPLYHEKSLFFHLILMKSRSFRELI